ncbi:MAG: GxxExxY protein [Bacteroidota bacterium]
MPLDEETEKIATTIVDCAYKVHKKLGPGLLEKVYEQCLVYELRKAGLNCKTQLPIAVQYENLLIQDAFKLDILVEDKVVIEMKAVERMHESVDAQLLSYLTMTGKRLGFLINFKVRFIRQGITRFVK